MTTITGYDGNEVARHDRVELHPSTDLWMQGARYGRAQSLFDKTTLGESIIKVKLDKLARAVMIAAKDLRSIEHEQRPQQQPEEDTTPRPLGLLTAMCEWLIEECGFPSDKAYELTEAQLKQEIALRYEGGVKAFADR